MKQEFSFKLEGIEWEKLQDSAFEKLIYGRTYTAASMYIQRYELSTDFEVTWLSPYEYATSFFYWQKIQNMI